MKRIMPALLLVCLTAMVVLSCGRGHSISSPRQSPAASIDPGTANPPHGMTADGFHVDIVDSSLSPLPHPERVISLEKRDAGGGTNLSIASAAERLPDDVYLIVTYDPRNYGYKGSEYGGAMGDALHVEAAAGPGRVDLGVARPQSARAPLAASAESDERNDIIFSVHFSRGPEEAASRTASAAPAFMNTVTDLSATDMGGNIVRLTWSERHDGDYDNNGEVSVADITPIALHYLETTATTSNAAKFALVDGDATGEIGVSDITPIAINYLSTISGYEVYRADLGGAPLPPGDATAPSAIRPLPDPTDGHLAYAFTDSPAATGTYSYTVQAFSTPADPNAIAFASNAASVDFTRGGPTDTTPPSWNTTVGITDAQPGASSILVKWGKAADAESSPVTYRVYLSTGANVDFAGPDLVVDVPAGAPDADTHSYIFWSLPPGTEFSVGVRARDSAAPSNEEKNTASLTVDLLTQSSGWLDFRGGPARSGAAGNFPPPLTTVFEYPVDPSGIQSVTTCAIAADALGKASMAFTAVDETLHAIDVSNPASVAEVWNFPTGNFIDSSPAVSAGRVFFGSRDGYLRCLDAATGAEKWKYFADANVAGSPVVVNDVVYVGTGQGDLLMLSLIDGSVRWPNWVNPGVDTVMASSPAVVNGRVYVGSGLNGTTPGAISRFDTVTQTEAWNFPTPAGVVATPASGDGLIMAGDLAGSFYILNEQGALLHNVPLDGGISASAAYLNGVAYVATLNRKVYAINTTTGGFVWPAPFSIAGLFGIRSSPLIAGGFLYVAAGNGHLYALDAATGSKVWEWSGSSTGVDASPVIWDNRMYLEGGDNTLRAFDPTFDFDPPIWQGVPGLLVAGYNYSPPDLSLHLLAGNATDAISPPVRWRFYLSNIPVVDFANADAPTGSTISFGPENVYDYVFSSQDMTRARTQWSAHRGWYAARALDSAIPANSDSNTVTIDYTIPWAGESTALAADTGETYMQFDAAPAGFYGPLLLVYKTNGAEWKITQYKETQLVRFTYDLLPAVNKRELGFLDVEPGSGPSAGSYFCAAVVPESSFYNNLYLGTAASAIDQFSMVQIEPSGHNWGTVSVAIDNRGYPGVADAYCENLLAPLTQKLWPYYHYLDTSDPPLWRDEIIDNSGMQTRYVDLSYKSDGTAVVAFTKSTSLFGTNTGLFVAERTGVNAWDITAVDGGAMADNIGDHLSMVLDENERPVILYEDLTAELEKVALPTGDKTWNIVPLGDLNTQAWQVHDGTCLVKTPGGGTGDGSADYACAHFSQYGTNRRLDKVFVRAFGKVGGTWQIAPDNAYWVGDVDQATDDSANIVLFPESGTLNLYAASEWGAAIYHDGMSLEHLLR